MTSRSAVEASSCGGGARGREAGGVAGREPRRKRELNWMSSHLPPPGLARYRLSLPRQSRVFTNCERISFGRRKINLSTVFVGQAVGLKEVQDDIWLVSFMDYDLGDFDLEARVLKPLDNPFGPRLS